MFPRQLLPFALGLLPVSLAACASSSQDKQIPTNTTSNEPQVEQKESALPTKKRQGEGASTPREAFDLLKQALHEHGATEAATYPYLSKGMKRELLRSYVARAARKSDVAFKEVHEKYGIDRERFRVDVKYVRALPSTIQDPQKFFEDVDSAHRKLVVEAGGSVDDLSPGRFIKLLSLEVLGDVAKGKALYQKRGRLRETKVRFVKEDGRWYLGSKR